MSDDLDRVFFPAHRLEAMPERPHRHQFNERALRHTRDLGALAGFSDMGLAIVRVRPGDETTEFHVHGQDEEFLYILSGRGEADIGEHHLEVRPGDAMLFSKNSPPHAMRNPEDAQQDLVYLMGGTRSPVDVCTYPRAGLRMYRIDGAKEFVPIEQVKPVS